MALVDQDGTLLGPLTTKWPIPASCTAVIACSTCDAGFRGQVCMSSSDRPTGFPVDNADCWPPVATGIAPIAAPFFGWGYYSPGISCPIGYSTACTNWSRQFKIRDGETAIGCCPTGFGCANINGNTCISVAIDTNVAVATCDDASLLAATTVSFPNTFTVTGTDSDGNEATDVASRRLTVFAPMYQLNFRATDLPTSTSASSTRPTSSTPSPTNTSDSSNQGSGGEGLSSGAKAGIGVGVALGVLALLGVAFLFWRHRRKHGGGTAFEERKELPGSMPYTDHGVLPSAELEGRGRFIAELPTNHGTSEMGDSHANMGVFSTPNSYKASVAHDSSAPSVQGTGWPSPQSQRASELASLNGNTGFSSPEHRPSELANTDTPDLSRGGSPHL